jgi:phage gp36-like protein
MPTAPATLLTSETWIDRLYSSIAKESRLDDDFSDTISATEQEALDEYVIYVATEMTMAYLLNYAPAKLATSNLAFYLCTVIAVWLLCQRRFDEIPAPVQKLYDNAIAMLKMIRDGKMQLPRIPRRRQQHPKFSNVIYNPKYPLRKLRVQRPLSDRSETDRDQFRSQGS